ncbi:MAG: glycosyltransferase [Acidobacteriota bacterium]|nr:glycosyltransferase [Acidobacteriota bacterium]
MTVIAAPPPPAVPVLGRLGGRPEAALVVSGAVASVTNYGYTVAVLWLLPASQYAIFGSIAALFLVCGTISSASTPWVLAREVTRSAPGSERRARAISFGLVSVVIQGLAAGGVTAAVAAHYASGATVAVVLGASVAIFVEAAGIGYLQGLERFGEIALLRIAEVVVKLVAGLLLLGLGGGATGAVAGFLLGASVVTVVTVAAMRSDLRWVRGALWDRELWRVSRGLLGIQSGVAVMAGMDIAIGSLFLVHRTLLATYQAAQILGRIPVFVGTALSLVVFARLARAEGRGIESAERVVALFLGVCVPVAVGTATLPTAVTDVIFPSGYHGVATVLPLVAAGGLAMGFVNLVSTVFQATERYAPAVMTVWAGIFVGVPIEYVALRTHGIVGLAWAVIGVGSGVSLVLSVLWWRMWGLAIGALVARLLSGAVVSVPLLALRPWAPAWICWSVLAVAPWIGRGLVRAGHTPGPDRGARPRPRILHLGFEDHIAPGAGGGSVRNHEINRRLVADYDITVVCSAYPGSVDRTEDGVRYVHVGLGRGMNTARMSYFFALPFALWRHPSDLVVEDFAAPLSSVAVPWMTRRPVIGVVQWLFAKEKAKQYHLPFNLVERIGLGSHRDLISVSDDLAGELRRRNPKARVAVVANGLRDDAFASGPTEARSDLGYIGRLEIAQKGLDWLLEAYALIAGRIEQDLLLAGDGPDAERLATLAGELGIDRRVHFVGRVDPADRGRWLAARDLLVVPSRYETFGMVAAEALAAATPVVSFDLPCLRGLVSSQNGALVAPYDVAALAETIEALATDPTRRRQLGAAGPGTVGALRWDKLAAAQGELYRDRLGGDGAAWSKTATSPWRPAPAGARAGAQLRHLPRSSPAHRKEMS